MTFVFFYSVAGIFFSSVPEDISLFPSCLQGRSGGVAEPVRVEDQRVKNENQDDGGGPDKEMVETCNGVGQEEEEEEEEE